MNEVNSEIIKKLIPIRELAPAERSHLFQMSKVRVINMGDRLYAKDYTDIFIYLLEGKIDLCEQYCDPVLIHSDDQLKYSLFRDVSNNAHMVANTTCKVIFIEKRQFNSLMENDMVMEKDHVELDISYVETNIYNEIFKAIQSDQLKLPALPEIALKVKSAISKDDVGVNEVARIAESDPVIVVRLIQVANSPLVRGVEPVNTISDAIVRLGLSMAQNLIVSFSMKQLFATEQQVLKARMQQMYKHSVEISAISFALAKKLKNFDADQLLLAGLIHDIGVIPILTYIDETGLEIASEKEVDKIVAKLRAAVGSLVVKNWGFSAEMVAVVEQAENWFRNSPEKVDMADIVIVAQIYSLLQHKEFDSLPDVKQVPVFKKIFLDDPGPEFVMNVLNDAQNVIDEVKQILSI